MSIGSYDIDVDDFDIVERFLLVDLDVLDLVDDIHAFVAAGEDGVFVIAESG